MPGWIVDLFQVKFDSLREIAERLVDRLALAGDVYFQALRDVPVLFPVQGRGQSAGRLLHPSSVAAPQQIVAGPQGATTALGQAALPPAVPQEGSLGILLSTTLEFWLWH